MSYTLDFPIQYIADPDGFATIGLGKLYIGVVDGDPAFEPADRVQAYIARQNDTDLAIPQPIDLSAGGVPVYLGSPVTLKINQSFSVAVLDRLGQQVYYSPKSGEMIDEINDLSAQVAALAAATEGAIDNVSELFLYEPVADSIYYLKEYSAGTGIGGGHLQAKAGAITPDNIETFASATAGIYFERINSPDLDLYMAGGGGADDGAELQLLISSKTVGINYSDETASSVVDLDLPAQKALVNYGTRYTNLGGGTYKFLGASITFMANPSEWNDWNDAPGDAVDGLLVDYGGYGERLFGTNGIVSAVTGAMNVPDASAIPNHCAGVSGWAKTTDKAAVALFGYADVLATGGLVWGANTVSQDNGFATTVWGYECDINVDNANTTVIGIEVVGGSSVDPNTAIGFKCNPIGFFASPPKRWTSAFESADSAAVIAFRAGSLRPTNSGMQEWAGFYMNASDVRTKCYSLTADSSGNLTMENPTGSLLRIGSNGQYPIAITGNQLGFHGVTPVGRPTGFGTPTGAARLANFPGATATLAQTSGALADLIAILINRGDLGV